MYFGLGVDIVSIKRIKKIYENFGEKFLKKIGIFEKNLSFEEVAGIFAVKEAGFKALKPLNQSFNPKEIVVVKRRGGAPILYYRGKLKKRWGFLGKPHIFLSLTHEKDYAIAIVILEKGSNEVCGFKSRKKRSKFKGIS